MRWVMTVVIQRLALVVLAKDVRRVVIVVLMETIRTLYVKIALLKHSPW